MGVMGKGKKPVIKVAAALILRKGEVLLAKRHRDDAQGGLWEFPGGALEPGESLRECLARELEEELGIQVEVGDEVAAIPYDYGEFVVHLYLFRARIARGEPAPLGCEEVRWVPWEEVEKLPLAPADKELLKLLEAERTSE
jgi:mutator protein MutT